MIGTTEAWDRGRWAEAAADELAATGRVLLDAIPGAEVRPVGEVTVYLSGTPFPPANGVVATRALTSTEDLATAVTTVAATGLPHLVQLRRGLSPVADAWLGTHGYVVADAAPAMVLPVAGQLAVPEVPGLWMERVTSAEGLELHLQVACAAFEMPYELLSQVFTLDSLAQPSIRVYLGWIGAKAVTTAVGIVSGNAVGVYTVGTLPPERGKGYGAAITAVVVAEAVRTGATWSYLQSSESGFGVYQRLGYEIVDRWELWAPTA